MTRQGPIQAEALDQDDAASVVQSLHDDFVGLIAIFDRQLTRPSGLDTGKRARIADARAAAERGLRLSEELVGMLRTTD